MRKSIFASFAPSSLEVWLVNYSPGVDQHAEGAFYSLPGKLEFTD